MRKGLLRGLSIGYIPKKIRYAAGGKIRVLEEIELKEISLVTFPANPKANVTWVKSVPSMGKKVKLSRTVHSMKCNMV